MDRRQNRKKDAIKWAGGTSNIGLNQSGELAERIRTMTQRAYDAGAAMGSNRVTSSHMKYWHDFCEVMGINENKFGVTQSRITQGAVGQTQLGLLELEISTFYMFATYIICFPRKRKVNTDSNTTTYAEQVISSHHLRSIKKSLDLENNQTHKVMWALWLTQCQGVMRSGDLIRRRADHKRSWNPELDTHRGRLSVELAKDAEGKMIGARISLRLKPNKTDQAGVMGTVKTFIVDTHPDALSAGEAMRQMLKGDKCPGSPTLIPLFRNPATGEEITYEESAAALKRCLRVWGYPEMARGVHCLRIGGATAYANSPAGRPVISGFMGLWQSDTHYDYLHACSPRLEQAGLAVAREKGMKLAQRPGPVSSYARAGY